MGSLFLYLIPGILTVAALIWKCEIKCQRFFPFLIVDAEKLSFMSLAGYEEQVESRYLLSTSLMQKMLDYKKRINKNVAFSFVNNWLYVSIPNKGNLFEASLTKPINNKEFIRSNYEYFQLLTGLVNDMDLNTRIWR